MNFDTQAPTAPVAGPLGPAGVVGTAGRIGSEQDVAPVQQPPQTGDIDLDAAMQDLARAQSRSFGERIDSGERVHRLLQGRLGDLGRA